MKANEVFRFETISPGNTFLIFWSVMSGVPQDGRQFHSNVQVDPLQPNSDFGGLSLLFRYY